MQQFYYFCTDKTKIVWIPGHYVKPLRYVAYQKAMLSNMVRRKAIMRLGPQKKIEHKRMRLEVENNSQEVKIGYFENAGSVFAGFPCVHGMSGRVTSIVGWN